MIYNERLKQLRTKSFLTQQDLGNIIGVDRKVYSHFETEYTIMPIKHLAMLCNYFDVSIDYIFNFTILEKYSSSKKEINLLISGERLKEMRYELKLTQDKLGNLLKINRSTLSKYEKGINIIATPFLYTICKKYNISADYLLGRIDSPKYLK